MTHDNVSGSNPNGDKGSGGPVLPKVSKPDSSAPPPAYKPIGILRWLYRRFFAHIQIDARWTEQVTLAAAQGTVVYVMRSLSFLDFLCLDFLVKRFGLPLVRFVNDLGLWILEPFGKGERRLSFRRQVPEDEALARAIKEHHSALLFLRRPPQFGRIRPQRKKPQENDLLERLIQVQREQTRPIILVAQTFVWSQRPIQTKPSVTDFLFGPSEWPGKFRVFFQFLFNYRNALLRSGEAFSLRDFIDRNEGLSNQEIANKLRYALLRRIERERTVVLGPIKKSPQRIREELLSSPRVMRWIESTARASGKSIDKVRLEASGDLRKLCASQSAWMLALFHAFLSWLFRKLYRELLIDLEGMERVRTAGRQGTIIFLPSHKSHMDYLVMSEVLYSHSISPPLIAAGDNLNFWPVGPLLRRGGAFFIKRSFRGQKLYSTLVEAYIRKLIKEGFNIEFFPEGGRSRTGKLLQPKLGLLSMIIDAGLQLKNTPLFFVPVYIGYERIIEEGAYAREVEGAEKKPETLKGLLSTTRILKSKYGRLHLRFGQIFSLESMIRSVQNLPEHADPSYALSPSQRRALVQRTAFDVTFEINRVTAATPSAVVATTLLNHRRRGISEDVLKDRCGEIIDALQRNDAALADVLRVAGGVAGVADKQRVWLALRESLAQFEQSGLVSVQEWMGAKVYTVAAQHRAALEYYKNNTLHFFVPQSLVANAVLANSTQSSESANVLADRVQQLSRLFKHEFTFQNRLSIDDEFNMRLAQCRDAGMLVQHDDHVFPAGGQGGRLLRAYAFLLRPYFEAYRLAVLALRETPEPSPTSKSWIKHAAAYGKRLYWMGDIECYEAVAQPKLESALQALRDHGAIRLSVRDQNETIEIISQDLLSSFEQTLQPYLEGLS